VRTISTLDISAAHALKGLSQIPQRFGFISRFFSFLHPLGRRMKYTEVSLRTWSTKASRDDTTDDTASENQPHEN
jgi:hypothetical protein